MADLTTAHATLDHTGLTGVGGTAAVAENEIRNFPSMEKADGAQPEWWEESAGTATLTEEDVVGESITETWDRCLKVVTTADVYGYQRFTYADEQRLKVGKVVSARVAVWAVGGVTARVRIQDSGGSLGVSTTTAAAWTVLTVQGVTLTGTTVDLRLEVNNGTAYFVPLAFGIGSTAPVELHPRGTRFFWSDPTQLVSLNTLGDPNTWTDVDCTSATSNLACMAQIQVQILGVSGSSWDVGIRRNGSADALGADVIVLATSSNSYVRPSGSRIVPLDDGQIFEYILDRWQGTGTIGDGQINLQGWWEWA